jgi:hypothetical protein
MVAYWVTEGADRCIVGRIPFAYRGHFSRLDGRLAQVCRILPFRTKFQPGGRTEYSVKYQGVMHAFLIGGSVDDTPDQKMNDLLQHIDDYTSSEEEDGE